MKVKVTTAELKDGTTIDFTETVHRDAHGRRVLLLPTTPSDPPATVEFAHSDVYRFTNREVDQPDADWRAA